MVHLYCVGNTGDHLHFFSRSLEATSVPLDDPNVKIVIVNSNVRHELTGSEYKTRRDECESVASHLGVKSLRFATRDNLNGTILLAHRLYIE